MRRALVFLGLVACKTVATDRSLPDSSAKKVVASAVAEPAPATEAPLAWAARPPKDGPLYPVVDGTCSRGEVWPAGKSALFTFGGPMARFDDDGLVVGGDVLAASDPKQPFAEPEVNHVVGTWPSPLVIHGDEHGMGRTRGYDSTWYREANGWALLGSYREKGEPSYSRPILYKGWIVTARGAPLGPSSMDDWSAHIMVAYPAEKGAAPIPGLSSLARAKLFIHRFAASDSTLYAFGWSNGATSTHVIRALKDGKVSEVAGNGKVIGTTATALYTLDEDRVWRFENGKNTRLAYKPPTDVSVLAANLAPNGDVWLVTSKSTIVVLHGDEVAETPLPPPAKPLPKENVLRAPSSGAALAGVDVGDPYAIGHDGVVFHHAESAWKEVPLPASPFATTGKYKAQSLYVPAKGDLYVNAGYVEKGVGWTSANGYRAILRTRRPKEVLRCQDPKDELNGVSGGLMPFPPLADASCKTPVVILLRLGWGADRVFPADSDFPSVRAVIKETPSLGAAVDLVEVVSGTQRFLAAKVPSFVAGQELAKTAGAKLKVDFHTTRPEVVCGTPKEERLLTIDVATGNVKK